MLTTVEQIIDTIQLISGVEVVVIGETTEGTLLAGWGDTSNLSTLVKHQAFIFQQQAEMLEETGLSDGLEETLLTLHERYHIARFLTGEGTEGFFLYVVLSREGAKLGMARVKLAEIAQKATLTADERARLLGASAAPASPAPVSTASASPEAAAPNPFLFVAPTEAVASENPPTLPDGSTPGSPTAMRMRRLGRLLHLSRRSEAGGGA